MLHRIALLAPLFIAVLAGSAAAPAPELRPSAEAQPRHRHSLTDIPDMSKAVPASQIGKLPPVQERYRALKAQAGAVQPKVEKAKAQSDSLNAEAEALRAKLIETAERVEGLEAEKIRLDAEIVTLTARQNELSANFARDRVAVSRLLALLERTQHDLPPVLVLSAGDALTTARRTMLLGASLPRVYAAAAGLSRRLAVLRATRADLIARRADSARNAAALTRARSELDHLLAIKQREAETAAGRYETLSATYAVIAQQANGLGELLTKVAAARASAGPVNLTGPQLRFAPKPGALARPVAGPVAPGGIEGVGGSRAPGVTFAAPRGGRVVAPADAKVGFAGPYHRSGQVLILELGDGYAVVLAGMGEVNVRVGDGVLAGEPLGTMPREHEADQLYVELRHGEKAMSPMPWLETGLRKAEKS